jgi:hypothetical protein
MVLLKSGLLRAMIMFVIAVAMVSRLLSNFANRPIPTMQVVGLLEILALIVPLLWINKIGRWPVIMITEILIWLGFMSIQSLVKNEYVASCGYALSCVICTGMFVWKLQKGWPGARPLDPPVK